MDADWDLHAVVRSFTTVTSSSSSAAAGTTTSNTGDIKTDLQLPVLPPPSVAVPPPLEPRYFDDFARKESKGSFNLGYISDPFGARNQDLQELFQSFCPSIKTLAPPQINDNINISASLSSSSSVPVTGLVGGLAQQQQQQQQQSQQQQQQQQSQQQRQQFQQQPPPQRQVFLQQQPQQQRQQTPPIQQFSQQQQRQQAPPIQQFPRQQQKQIQQQLQAQQQQQQLFQQFPPQQQHFRQRPPPQLKQSQFIFGTNNSVNSTHTIPAAAAASVVTVTSQSQIGTTVTARTSASSTQRNKKRKNLMKKVCHVSAEGLSSDVWAWRKYGQKPIKGSPYPRGYYRCSSSKGCPARKQVERNRSEPNMFIITYTAEHNHPIPTHRNSLAGSTRLKPTLINQPAVAAAATTPEQEDTGATTTSTTSTSSTTTATGQQPSCSSPATNNSSLSPKTENNDDHSKTKKADTEDSLLADNEKDFADVVLSGDFFKGLEDLDEFDHGAEGDCFSDDSRSPVDMEFPWLFSNDNGSNSKNTAAAGGS